MAQITHGTPSPTDLYSDLYFFARALDEAGWKLDGDADLTTASRSLQAIKESVNKAKEVFQQHAEHFRSNRFRNRSEYEAHCKIHFGYIDKKIQFFSDRIVSLCDNVSTSHNQIFATSTSHFNPNAHSSTSSNPTTANSAVEPAKVQTALVSIIGAFEKNDASTAYQIFHGLPSQTQNEIYSKHWEQMGKPTGESSDEELKKIAHPDFGKVSLLGLDERCNVASNKKAATIKAYLADYKSKTPQEAVPNNSTANPSSTLSTATSSSTPILRKPVSFTIIEAGGNDETQSRALTPLQMMDRVAYLFRNGQEQQALQEFSALPVSIQKAVYEALWFVRGRPADGNPIAHFNFGEVSFNNQEQRCFSSTEQKACAVELAKGKASLHAILDAFEKNDTHTAYQIVNDLPSQIQTEIYAKHWIQMGKPTDQSSDEALRKIAHLDFGKVSLLGLEARCNVASDKKAATIKAYLADYNSKIKTVQDAVDQIQKQWPAIDQANVRGGQKNDSKKSSLDKFAQNTVPLFMNVKSVTRPDAKGQSFQSLAEAYATTYPCLRPFFFQLIPGLRIAGDQIIQGTPAHDMPKPSQAVQINLSSMQETDRRAYRKNVMDDTLGALQRGYYINSKRQKVGLHLTPAVESLYLLTRSDGNSKRQGTHKTRIFLDNKDCLTVTRECAQRGLSPIVLDAASDDHFGGGYKTGAGAQEENMTRRSGLCIAADTTLNVQKRGFYPLSKAGPAAGLYVANVPVFRGEEGEGYPFLDQPFETAVAIMAAHNFNEQHQKKNGVPDNALKKLEFINGEYRLPAKEAAETKQKLQSIFQMAEDQKHDCVVLVALGCGAFRNPPKHFAELAMEVISQNFPNSFKEIHFSVIDDHNTGKQHNIDGNYAMIKATLENGASQNQISTIGAKFTVTQ